MPRRLDQALLQREQVQLSPWIPLPFQDSELSLFNSPEPSEDY